MPTVYLPFTQTISLGIDDSGNLTSERIPGVSVNAQTLGELIEVVMNDHKCTIEKNPESGKCFVYFDNRVPEGVIVDIHVKRGDRTICPKQDLSFKLYENDQVNFGMPAC